MVFVQPDMESGILGEFDHRGMLARGQQINVSINGQGIEKVPVLELSQPFGPDQMADVSNDVRKGFLNVFHSPQVIGEAKQ